MEKQSIVEELKNTKITHLKWLQRAHSLISSLAVEHELIPLEYSKCVFAQWLSTSGAELATMPGMSVIDPIGEKHKQLHDTYSNIFEIYFGESGKGFFSKLLNTKKKISPEEQTRAEDYYAQLEEISHEFQDLVGKLERRVSALGEDFFHTKKS